MPCGHVEQEAGNRGSAKLRPIDHVLYWALFEGMLEPIRLIVHCSRHG
jgi:hypothetical protein